MLLSRRQLHRWLAVGLFAIACSSAPSLAFADNLPRVLMKTSMGALVIELNPEKAPISVNNFLQYASDGFYNGTIFHRIISGFMIQGGGLDEKLNEKPTRDPIKIESKNGLKNKQYTIAMARTQDPDSASAQFFINVQDNRFLDWPGRDGWGYAVFGKVISGTEVVDKIQLIKPGEDGLPTPRVVIESVTVIE
jgi:peptidyl-prolyl cis-trans isomerase A (cyclophilin A)/peptidyl-prolyl cis-trans isomerase B (cyclophilin B)